MAAAALTLIWNVVRGKFLTVPYPEEDCSGKTIIVTGANSGKILTLPSPLSIRHIYSCFKDVQRRSFLLTAHPGLGREACRHFVRLGAAKVILACRNLDKGEEAKKDIEGTTQKQGVVDVWQLDLASFDSVREFAARVNKLDRVDVLINNASFLTFRREMVEGHESTLTVNVISTYLLTLLVLPALRRTSSQCNITPHIVVVSSEAAFLSPLPERDSDSIFKALDAKADVMERYNISKLLQLMIVPRLAEDLDASRKGRIVVTGLHPGFCGTELFRQLPFPLSLIYKVFSMAISRTAEMGSRTLLAAAFAKEDLHGKFMADAELHDFPKIMQGEEGAKLVRRVWDELMGMLEGIESGSTSNI
ncbi:hypothetical protein FZEAL_5714 [Fusarium zealandicum]|uniref:NAD(P)-binding protein n=1 Tax=Fusarium zealandicum TaxID=1053134 RepID=A0A8H4XKK6_9HYPO|nr:hypothetical protein FZEAL_5714 [Fusarium zealandicum]